MSNINTKSWLSVELQKVHSVVIYVNSGVQGVLAPKDQLKKPSFTVMVSHHFDRPLLFREKDLKSDFNFDGGFETCNIPWNSIWAAHEDGKYFQIKFWNENSPGSGWDKALCEYLKVAWPLQSEEAEASAQLKNASPKPQVAETEITENGVTGTEAIESPGTESQVVGEGLENPKANNSKSKSPKSRGHLRLVK